MLDRRAFFLATGLCLAANNQAYAQSDDDRRNRKAGDRGDHVRARRALQQGEIRSLSEIMAELRSQLGGEVIEVELTSKGGTYVYEFKVLTSSGRVSEVEVDAATGKIIKTE